MLRAEIREWIIHTIQIVERNETLSEVEGLSEVEMLFACTLSTSELSFRAERGIPISWKSKSLMPFRSAGSLV